MATLTETLFALPIAERVAIADRLYASVPEDWQKTVDHAWLEEAEWRAAEMETDSSTELSHEEFLAGIDIHRTRQ